MAGIRSSIVAGLLLTLPISALGWEMSKTFQVKSGGQLDLDTEMGSVYVTTHEGSEVKLFVDVEGLSEEEFIVTAKADNGDVTIEGEKHSSSWWGGTRRAKFKLTVPKEYDVRVKTAGGSIEVEELKGEVEIKTSGGSLDVNQIVGDVRGHTSGGSIDIGEVNGFVKVTTSGGSIDVDQINGDLKAHTSGGSIRVDDVEGNIKVGTSGGSIRIKGAKQSVNASTSGGSVTAYFEGQPRGDSKLNTSGGSVTAYINPELKLDIKAAARKVVNKLDMDVSRESKGRLEGQTNGGGPMVSLSTSSGKVTIKELR